MSDKQDMTTEDCEKLFSAVIGDGSNPTFATAPMAGGDIGIVLRAKGGIEILSIMPDNPDAENLSSLGVRGLFALTLFKLANDPALMIETLQIVNREIAERGETAIKLHS